MAWLARTHQGTDADQRRLLAGQGRPNLGRSTITERIEYRRSGSFVLVENRMAGRADAILLREVGRIESTPCGRSRLEMKKRMLPIAQSNRMSC